MATPDIAAIDRMISALEGLKGNVGAHKSFDANRDALADVGEMIGTELETIVWTVGGDGSYIEHDFRDMRWSFTSAFRDAIDGPDNDDVGAKVAHRRAVLSIVYDSARA